MNTSTIRDLTSIIVPCWNEREFTRQCVVALKSHTRPPWELILIDNGSTDGTGTYLAGARDLAAVPVTVVTNAKNLGFPAAINQGLRLARGEYLVMLNNDVVVTDGWLDQLIALANARPGRGHGSPADDEEEGGQEQSNVTILDLEQEIAPPGEAVDGMAAGRGPARAIGLVGPMSNYAAPPQLVESVPYRDVAEMHKFARRWRDDHLGLWLAVPKLSGFCLLMKRAVYDAIGGLDERFGIGFFDDDDLAERARRTGFELAVAHDLFVHHFGSRTFAGNGINAEKLLDENARRFADKWGLSAINGRRVAIRPWHGSADAHAVAENIQVRLQDGESLPRHNGTDSRASSSLPSSRLQVRPSSSFDGAPESDLGERAKVSLTMIVRDEEKNIAGVSRVRAGSFRRDRGRRYGQRGSDRRDCPVVRCEGLRFRLGRQLLGGPERGALACGR